MTPQQRESARLYVVDGKTQAEIAATVGVTQQAVSKWFAIEEVAALIDELETQADEHCVKVSAHNLRASTERLCRITKRWQNALDDEVSAEIGYTLLDADSRYKQMQGLNLSLDALHGMQDKILNRRKIKHDMRLRSEENRRKAEAHAIEIEIAQAELELLREANKPDAPDTLPHASGTVNHASDSKQSTGNEGADSSPFAIEYEEQERA